ncbi:MAG: Hpt domain-containing protein [Phycisphaeraceae bacterium]|nr:Hpt domain-containing protein [Phycisphaerae bacterium]MBX3391062.1 Hpt domain-containing protein [Phycisphaeraceae bacterium]HRJ49425.1 Hpt domain-containing protein [Phycisphaerales bacterium]
MTVPRESTSMQGSAAKSESAAASNSVRLDVTRLNALLDELDRRDRQGSGANRQYVRWPFRQPHVELMVAHLGGSRCTIRVACRNLSCGGISVLHSAYLHSKSRCEVALPHVDGRMVMVGGSVARCSHLTGVVHEVGIKFDQPVRINDFVDMTGRAGAFSIERVDPTSLRGSVIFAGKSELDQRLMRHYLRETQVRLHIFATPEETVAKARQGVDLILCDSAFMTDPRTSILKALREAGVLTPVIAVLPFATARALPSNQADSPSCPTITKPFTQATLFQAVAEYIMMDDGKGLTTTSLASDHPSNALLDSFAAEIHRHAASLDQAVRESNAESCMDLCRQIAGVAPIVGFEKLSELAGSTEKAIGAAACIEHAIGEVRRLISTCQNVRTRD